MQAPKTLPGRNQAKKTARRVQIAKALVNDTPPSVLAEQCGISRQMLNREIREPETQQFIREAMRPHRERLRKIAERAVATVERALQDDSEDRPKRVEALRIRIAQLEDAINMGEPDPWLLRELREHERMLHDMQNDFTPNLKAVERARDLLEMAEGKRTDGDGSTTGLRFAGTMEELLCYYRELAIVGRPSLP